MSYQILILRLIFFRNSTNDLAQKFYPQKLTPLLKYLFYTNLILKAIQKVTADSDEDNESIHDDSPAVEEQDEGKATFPLTEQNVPDAVTDGLTQEQEARADDVITEAPAGIMEESET